MTVLNLINPDSLLCGDYSRQTRLKVKPVQKHSTSSSLSFHRFTDMEQLLRNEGYVPYGDESKTDECKLIYILLDR